MSLDVFYEIIIPLFEMKNSTLICISTPVDSFNFYTALLNLHHPETGLPIFNTYQLDLVCERCKKKVKPERCTHNNKYIPPWKGEEKNKIVRFILKDMVHVLKRESLGMVSDEGNSLIEQVYIKQFKETPYFKPDMLCKPRFVTVLVDPNNGGENEMAVVAMAHMAGRKIIVGMDSHQIVGAKDSITFFKAFITGLREHPWLRNAYIVFCAERNSGHESGYLAEDLTRNFDKVILVKQKVDKDYGWWTKRENKLRYAYTARDSIVTGTVCILEDFVCTNPWISSYEKRQAECLKKFYNQMKKYKLTLTKPTNPFSQAKVTVSGKVNEQGKLSEGFNDDLFFVFTWACDMITRLLYRSIPNINYNLIFSE